MLLWLCGLYSGLWSTWSLFQREVWIHFHLFLSAFLVISEPFIKKYIFFPLTGITWFIFRHWLDTMQHTETKEQTSGEKWAPQRDTFTLPWNMSAPSRLGIEERCSEQCAPQASLEPGFVLPHCFLGPTQTPAKGPPKPSSLARFWPSSVPRVSCHSLTLIPTEPPMETNLSAER